jgi:hypothetical protein
MWHARDILPYFGHLIKIEQILCDANFPSETDVHFLDAELFGIDPSQDAEPSAPLLAGIGG